MKSFKSPTNLAALIDFIDRLAVDDKLYWRFADTDAGDLELTWHRDATPRCWGLKTRSEPEPIRHDATSLLEALATLGLDSATAERQIGATILMQAVYADLVVQGAIQLFGADAVESSREGMRQFLGQVQKAATTLTAEPKLKLITRS